MSTWNQHLNSLTGQLGVALFVTYSAYKLVYCASSSCDYNELDSELAESHAKGVYGLFWPISSLVRKGSNAATSVFTKKQVQSHVKLV